METEKLPQALKLPRLQTLQFVVWQVQISQIRDWVECGVVEGCDLVGAQNQLFKPADPLESQSIHSGNVIVVQVEPDKMVEPNKLASAKTGEAVVP